MNHSKQLQVSPSPLHLDGYFLKRLSFSVCEDFEKVNTSVLVFRTGLHPQLEQPFDSIAPSLEIGFTMSKDEEEVPSYRFSLAIKSIKKEGSPHLYDFDVEMEASFTWMIKDETVSSELEAAIKTSAINIMYSLIRETLASATARSAFPAFILPSARLKFIDNDKKPSPKLIAPKQRQTSVTTKKKTTKRVKKS